ncbi:MAG: aminomethyl-transferring glycine dehydrogenase subunit GcvPA [Candidatus Latescibacteria bacterium]|nr:aminomethyl-transferring glycine dehydrogenase subunit GcvPA [Candidatus Latescibacterota bacterium]
MRYLPHTPEGISAMLKVAGATKTEDLFSSIPRENIKKEPLDLPAALSEWELNEHMDSLANMTAVAPEYKLYIGAGCYDHFVPYAISCLLSRSEFMTAYTPYQPEVSQGTLQGIYEYQTLICRLLGMDVANGSMYDGASALAEAFLMAIRITGRKTVAIPAALHPLYRSVVKTYLRSSGCEIIEIPYGEDGRTSVEILKKQKELAAVAVQSPNFFGCIEDLHKAADYTNQNGALLIATFTEPLAFGLLKSPGSFGADIVCGEGRSLGLSQALGGMSLGIFATKKEYVRNMPGRLVGKTVDREGNREFVITLSTREQHIRREKATSNICTNQTLCALGAAMYLALLGKSGIRELAKLNYNKSEYLKQKLRDVGVKFKFESPTFNEFVIELPGNHEKIYDRLLERKIVPGFKLDTFYPELTGCLLVCATETKTKKDLDLFAEEIQQCMS